MTASPFIITFSGMVGTSKSPIAHYLSCNLNLPIFSTDVIRTETVEDTGDLNQSEYESRRDQRLTQLIKNQQSFILDASVDRTWSKYSPQLDTYHYQVFLISLNWSTDKTVQLYKDKNYVDGITLFEKYHHDHQTFLDSFSSVINLHLTDADFPNRLTICLNACQHWLKERKENA